MNKHKLCHYYFGIDRVPIVHPIGEDMFVEYWKWTDGRWRNYHDWYILNEETNQYTKEIKATTKGPETEFAWDNLFQAAIENGYKDDGQEKDPM